MKHANRLGRVVVLAVLLVASASARYADSTTHVTLITRAIKLATRDGYAELERFKGAIKKGAIEEDSGDPLVRFANHFFDPSTGQGMPKNWYAIAYEGRLPSFQDETRYASAYEWGRNGMPDHLDWDSAIEAYDYTTTSRSMAYEALGHVVHLLQDMAQPDHVACRPHPGSYSHDTVAGATTDRFHGAWKQAAEFLFPTNRIGFEALWAYKNADWPEGKESKKPRDLYEAFTSMAYEARAAEQQLGLPAAARGELALGLRSYASARADRGGVAREAVGEVVTYVTEGLALLWQIEQYRDFQDDMWMHFELQVPIVPTIPWPATAQTQPYIDLGNKLLPIAEERSAGLAQYFHDIVNVPPYVHSVTVEQEGQTRYHARWDDALNGVHLTGRTLVRETNQPLKTRTPTTVRLAFGPYLLVDGRENREPVDKVKVWFVPAGMSFGNQDPPDRYLVPGGAEKAHSSSTLIWQGLFMPEAPGGQLRIRAEDLDTHLPGRTPLGNVLDSDPADPARVLPQQGYPWTGYQPGDDLNHRIASSDACFWCQPTPALLKSHWAATWTGTITILDESRRPDNDEWAMFYEHKVQATFRSLANYNPWSKGVPMVTLTLGHADGTFEAKWQRGRTDPVRTATVTPVLVGGVLLAAPDGQHTHPVFMVVRPHPLNLPEDQIPGEPGFAEQPAGRAGTLAGRLVEERERSRSRVEWNFTMKEAEMPPHVAQAERLPDGEPIESYHAHFWAVLQPLVDSRSWRPADFQSVQTVMTDAMVAFAGQNHALGDLRSTISRTFEEANEAWLSDKPGNDDALYARKSEELKTLIDGWFTRRRDMERKIADATDRAAQTISRTSADLAKKLRESAEKLRTSGSEAFGGTIR